LNANIGQVARPNSDRAVYFGGNDDKWCFKLWVVTVGNHDYTEFTMGRIVFPQTVFDMLDLLEIFRRCW
jgi:hypothetical protein